MDKYKLVGKASYGIMVNGYNFVFEQHKTYELTGSQIETIGKDMSLFEKATDPLPFPTHSFMTIITEQHT